MSDSPELQALLDGLYHPELKTIDLSLDRLKAYLAHLGNPQEKLPPVVHVAGTNGKGSTIAFIRAAMEEAGYRCHVYTSPHLVSFCERIVLGGKQVEDAQLLPVLERIAADNKAFPLTFFEATTVAALILFAEHPADVVLLEVGMGGQYDATNVITQPAASVITPVSMDHQAFLGNDVGAIAYEKACIIKEKCPVVVANQSDEALAVIADKAKALQAPMQTAYAAEADGLGLLGKHQRQNAATAKAVLELLKSAFPKLPEDVAASFAKATWPARLQKMEHFSLLPDGWDVWLDGGHNAAAGEVIGAWLEEMAEPKFHVLCAMVQGKDSAAFLQPIAEQVASIHCVAIEGEPLSQGAQELYEGAQSLHPKAYHYNSVQEACEAIAHQSKAGRVLCCGSLYFAGKLLECSQ